jgi:hypothetical protein
MKSRVNEQRTHPGRPRLTNEATPRNISVPLPPRDLFVRRVGDQVVIRRRNLSLTNLALYCVCQFLDRQRCTRLLDIPIERLAHEEQNVWAVEGERLGCVNYDRDAMRLGLVM